MEADELVTNLEHFTGTEEYHRWGILYWNFFLTDGAKFLADTAGAYWLMDIIASYQKKLLARGEYFQVWTIKRDGREAVVYCTDGNDDSKHLVRQKILYTDFPLEEYSLYATWDGSDLVIMLKSEY